MLSGNNKQMDSIFSTYNIAELQLKNRSIRAGCFEGMCQDGQVTDALIEHHRAVAAGGVAMTTVAYCSVNFEGRAFGHELWMRREIIPDLKRLTDAVHGAVLQSVYSIRSLWILHEQKCHSSKNIRCFAQMVHVHAFQMQSYDQSRNSQNR